MAFLWVKVKALIFGFSEGEGSCWGSERLQKRRRLRTRPVRGGGLDENDDKIHSSSQFLTSGDNTISPGLAECSASLI